jgi:hypothetical protein
MAVSIATKSSTRLLLFSFSFSFFFAQQPTLFWHFKVQTDGEA